MGKPKRRRPPAIDAAVVEKWTAIARDPEAWLYTAQNLRAAAEVLGTVFVSGFKPLPPGTGETSEGVHPQSFGPMFQMLAGLALEALGKGILVAREPDLVADGQFARNWPTDHDLKKLLERVGISLDEHDQEFLHRLSMSVKWSGKYPVTRSGSELIKQSSTADLPPFVQVFDFLVSRLQAESARGQR